MNKTNKQNSKNPDEDLEGIKDEIIKEIKEYNEEKDQIKTMLGKVGGTAYSKLDTIINIVFLLLISFFFITELTTHWLPPFISLELSILLVSFKIVWMIHSQQKFNHFQFWILNSIEYRLNDLSNKVKKIDTYIESLSKKNEK